MQKETWALVTILVYSFILHMRFIPGLKKFVCTFNFLLHFFGFATVIMTYFGVNYYLSGLHSYAAGDPVPIPSQVYYTAIIDRTKASLPLLGIETSSKMVYSCNKLRHLTDRGFVVNNLYSRLFIFNSILFDPIKWI